MVRCVQLEKKKSPQAWFNSFREAILKTGHKKCHPDHTLFVKRNGLQKTILIMWVDGIVIIGNNMDEVES